MMNRRTALKQTAILSTGLALGASAVQAQNPSAPAAAPTGPYKLPPLPYAFEALEPHIDTQTMQIHHGKHHAAYVNNLNKALADLPELSKLPVETLVQKLDQIPEKIRAAVRNNGGGHANHSLFWQLLGRDGGKPSPELSKAMDQKFGSMEKFKEEFTKSATTVFGSGWAWLSLDGKDLKIENTPNQDTPLMQKRVPLLGLDVWEHAYYLKYQNRRPEYIAAFFNLIRWDEVSRRYAAAAKA